MSLFENEEFRWRETYFVLFEDCNRPSAEAVEEALHKLGGRYKVSDTRADEDGRLESLTLISPYDFAAMDISYVDGEEVIDQVLELQNDLKTASLSGEEREKLERLPRCNARFDIYHFEQVVGGEEEDDFLDPGALLIVMERLVNLSQGIGIDPQSGALV